MFPQLLVELNQNIMKNDIGNVSETKEDALSHKIFIMSFGEPVASVRNEWLLNGPDETTNF